MSVDATSSARPLAKSLISAEPVPETELTEHERQFRETF
jgi:hypothetical protein